MAKRLDLRLVELNLAASRQQAQGLIMASQVKVNDQEATKAGLMVSDTDDIAVAERDHYVSRGAHKLLKAIQSWEIDLSVKTCLDVGASTGGFTQVMLEAGARRVYSVDVGYGQFDYTLRQNEKVVVLERQNARHLTKELIPEPIDFFSMDVSFISVRLLLPVIQTLLAESAQGVVLIKPQFEAGKDQVGKGVITDPKIHHQVIEGILEFIKGLGLTPLSLGYSPIKGPKGNREFLLYLTNQTLTAPSIDIDAVVSEAHREL